MLIIRRLCSHVRGRHLVAFVMFGFFTYLFANNLTPSPRYEVQTEAKTDVDEISRWFGPRYNASIQYASDDGTHATVVIHEGDRRHPMVGMQHWNLASGINASPRHWSTPEWQELSRYGGWYRGNGLVESMQAEYGNKLLTNEVYWETLRSRMALARDRHVNSERATGRRIRDVDLVGSPFPRSIRFSPDGRFVSYVMLDRWPVHLMSDEMGDATAIEEISTGKRISGIAGRNLLSRNCSGSKGSCLRRESAATWRDLCVRE